MEQNVVAENSSSVKYHYYGRDGRPAGSQEDETYYYRREGEASGTQNESIYSTIKEDPRQVTVIMRAASSKHKEKNKKYKVTKIVLSIVCLVLIAACIAIGVALALFLLGQQIEGIPQASAVNFKGQEWTNGCDFPKDDSFANKLMTAEKCGPICASTVKCTHFTWIKNNISSNNNYNNVNNNNSSSNNNNNNTDLGACFMKSGSISKHSAVPTMNPSTVCGVDLSWDPDNWSVGCNFPSDKNDLSELKLLSPELCGPHCMKVSECSHYSWTPKGTCRLRGGTASREDVIVNGDKTTICGIRQTEKEINWNVGNWALGCDFPGNDFSKIKVVAVDCGGACEYADRCTHFAWTEFEGGTCFLKKGPVSRERAVKEEDAGMVCGIVEKN